MYYGNIKKNDIADGSGVRVSLFVSGCTHRCEGCFNEETWDFKYGKEYTAETQQEILTAMDFEHIAGLTLIGGEPMEPANQRVLIGLVREVRKRFPNKNIWCYTGYTFEELLSDTPANCEVTRELLENIDILVDGEFRLEKRNLMLKFRGSENQRIILCKKSLKEGRTILSDMNN